MVAKLVTRTVEHSVPITTIPFPKWCAKGREGRVWNAKYSNRPRSRLCKAYSRAILYSRDRWKAKDRKRNSTETGWWRGTRAKAEGEGEKKERDRSETEGEGAKTERDRSEVMERRANQNRRRRKENRKATEAKRKAKEGNGRRQKAKERTPECDRRGEKAGT